MSFQYFTGPFAPMCEMFVAQKRATGKLYETQAKILRQFDNMCKDYDIHNYKITEEIAQLWYVRRLNEKDSSRRDRIQVIQHFSEFLCKQGYPSYLFPVLPKRSEYHPPYIFTKEEIRKLFDRLDKLEPTNFTTGYIVYPLLFRTLYGCGLRISEALSLRKRDVELEHGILHIWHGKNDKERLVPISASLKDYFFEYWKKAHSETSDDIPFFYMNSAVPPARLTLDSKRQLLTGGIYCDFQMSVLSQELSLHSALCSFFSFLSVIFLIITPFINSTSMVQKWLIQIRETHALNKPIFNIFNCW